MDLTTMRRLLAPLHAAALELEQDGHDAGEIASLLDIDPNAVGPILRVARAKLAQLEMLEITDPSCPGASLPDRS
jgi:DNA-directed RNA polymerase specialized sigma24 family protein